MLFSTPALAARYRSVALATLVSLSALGLTGCGGEDDPGSGQAQDPATAIPSDQAPEPREESIALANQVDETLQEAMVYTGEEIWGDRWLVVDSLREVSDPDQCQQATLSQLEGAMDSTDPAVYAQVDGETQLDETASVEELDLVEFSTDADRRERVELEEARETDCVNEEMTEIEDDTVSAEAGEVSIREVVVSDFLTARTAELETGGTWLRYRSVYPSATDPQDGIAFDAWAESASERIDEIYTATR
ncbi:hypothetical protein [Auritidibacter sp. NML100628]|uniref:hypothetical protein n=1 Tax=Auritidibacter sp. NML100628 TaxID=2170742 RepID=UPI000D733849|nr:hypothetical protein [Auritidibacter sp. NML100628]PXA76705.1 hypothetical protein DCC24_06600 [Auritidibacter sp. NML100628]